MLIMSMMYELHSEHNQLYESLTSPLLYFSQSGLSALGLAILMRHFDCVDMLLEYGADINEHNKVSFSRRHSTHTSVHHSNQLSMPCYPWVVSKYLGATALTSAVINADSFIAVELVLRGADVNLRDKVLYYFASSASSPKCCGE